uniref:Uncharacterized protein n=1 Tax=Oryza sativa subsp. japonica TaxID=39947 RepID=Q2R3I6_ORYSJ|nr:hypothetical protein LOC_Os11g31810 [Oryza sativa Japonica Group]
MENFFEGRGFQSVVKMYYAEETFDKDVLLWWLHVDDPCQTWEDMTFVLRRKFVYSLDSVRFNWVIDPFKSIKSNKFQDSLEKVVAAAILQSLATKPTDSSKEFHEEDSQLLLKGAVLDQTVMHESDGLSMMAWEVHSDDTPVDVKGQRSNIFQTACKIQDKAEVFAALKVKKKAIAPTSKPRTALLQEGENDVTVRSKIIAYESSGENAIARTSECYWYLWEF